MVAFDKKSRGQNVYIPWQICTTTGLLLPRLIMIRIWFYQLFSIISDHNYGQRGSKCRIRAIFWICSKFVPLYALSLFYLYTHVYCVFIFDLHIMLDTDIVLCTRIHRRTFLENIPVNITSKSGWGGCENPFCLHILKNLINFKNSSVSLWNHP